MSIKLVLKARHNIRTFKILTSQLFRTLVTMPAFCKQKITESLEQRTQSTTHILITKATYSTIKFNSLLIQAALISTLIPLMAELIKPKYLLCRRVFCQEPTLIQTLLCTKSILMLRKNFLQINKLYRVRPSLSKKTSTVKRTSSIHEEKKMIPNESSKQIITASGGVRLLS